jgi:hypothetical protein
MTCIIHAKWKDMLKEWATNYGGGWEYRKLEEATEGKDVSWLRGLRPRANYTNRATTACRPS